MKIDNCIAFLRPFSQASSNMVLNQNVWTGLFLYSLLFMVLLSYSNIEQSYSPLKYNGALGLDELLTHYAEYKQDFKIFFQNTCAFHEGDTESSKKSFFFLWPMFAGADLCGGLTLGNLYRVTIIFGLGSIILMFVFLEKFFDAPTAFFSCFLYGFSPWFQHLFRAETYFGPSVLIALLILHVGSEIAGTKDRHQTALSFILGVLIGIGYYYYGMLRGLIFFALIVVFQSRRAKSRGELFYFFLGLILVLAYGIYLRVKLGGAFFDDEHLMANNLWDLLRHAYKMCRMIIYQIFTANVYQGSPASIFSHPRLLHPALFGYFILGIIIFFTQPQNYNKIFSVFVVILLFTILIANHAQVRRMILLIIPIHIFAGLGAACVFKKLPAVQKNKLAIMPTILFIFTIAMVVLQQLTYINTNILQSEKTLGFLRVGQEIRRGNIHGPVYLLTDNLQESINEVRDELFIRIENYDKILRGELSVKTIDVPMLNDLLAGKLSSEFHLVASPFVAVNEIKKSLRSHGLQISKETRVINTPGFLITTQAKSAALKNYYFAILEITPAKESLS